ncbi:MAG: pilus assembly protein N-terminal domain-containing protein [Planctomycetes bacterium]|nr:pilus assembly protein N-terminal domain-containing protein [Planctomycetota bacterium]
MLIQSRAGTQDFPARGGGGLRQRAALQRMAGPCVALAVWTVCALPAAVMAQAERPAPQPRPVEEQPPPPRILPFGPGRVRLPRLPGQPGPLGTTPIPSKETLEEYGRFVESFVDPRNTIDLVVDRTRLMLLKEPVTRTQVADERIAELSTLNPKQLILQGRRVGTTVLTLWFRDPKDNTEKILSYLVRVIPDPEAKARLEQVYKALEDEINEAFKDSVVHLFLVGDKLAVSGEAKDIADATQILRVARANAPTEDPARIPVSTLNVSVPPGDPNAPGGLPSLADFLVAGGPNVINLLRIPGEQQVMLRVTVAEINRAAARSIGLNFSITNNRGVQVFANNTGNIATGGTVGLFGGTTGVGANQNSLAGLLTNNLPVLLDNGQITLAINALRTLNYARSLAEPNLVAINGQTATFQAGGQFPVPVVTSGIGGGTGTSPLQGVNFVPFGVLLSFTPFITDKDRIRLSVAAEVSTRDLASGANIGGANVAGLTTRNFQTTVELREGQTLAVAGLIQNNLGADAQRVPFFGDLPFLSPLTSFNRTTSGEQELVVLITPELVSPLEPKEVSRLPGSDVFEPGDVEFYLLGRLESRRETDNRASTRTDFHRILSYRQCEQLYIYGPSGHSEDPPVPPPPLPLPPPPVAPPHHY